MTTTLIKSLGIFSLYIGSVVSTSNLVRETTSGPATGFIDSAAAPNVAQFLSIPYAEPPIGELRWQPPTLKKTGGAINATAFGNVCTQLLPSAPSLHTEDAPEFNPPANAPAGEDCLSVSIWTPKNACSSNASLPVIIWIPGGAFYTGGANVPYQNPTQWIERSQEHIVVSVNYRLNIFGFPNAAGLKHDEQNLGLLDQRLAVEWLRSNIANFGGDPKRMTLMGQSSGGMSIDFYNFAYPQDPIVQGYIMHSGTAQIQLGSVTGDHSNFTYVANHFGCGNGNNVTAVTGVTAAAPDAAEEEVSCLRKIPAKDIHQFLLKELDDLVVPALAFSYIVDKRTVHANYTSRAYAGNFSQKPALIGSTTNEGVAFTAYNRENGTDQVTADSFTLQTFLCPAVQTTRDRYFGGAGAGAGAKTFRYLYGGNFSNISPQPWEGAYHTSDMPLVFGTSGIARGNSTPFELDVSRKMQDYWVAFAKDQVNGLPEMGWDEYAPEGDAVLLAWEGVVSQAISEKKLEEPCDGLVPKPGARVPP